MSGRGALPDLRNGSRSFAYRMPTTSSIEVSYTGTREWPSSTIVSIARSIVADDCRAMIATRGTITSWTRRPPSSMTALIICSSSASRMPCSPPRSTIRRAPRR